MCTDRSEALFRTEETKRDSAVIIRTHFFDDDVHELAKRFALETNFDVIFVVDETNNTVRIPKEFKKLRFDRASLRQTGLFAPHNVGWRCGDYFFYVASTACPQYKYFWLIEPDVLINTHDLGEFFAPFNAVTDDLLAPALGPRESYWMWFNTIAQFVPKVYGCVFPILRLSKAAIDSLFEKRRHISATHAFDDGRDKFPNDEAHVASFLMNDSRFKCRDLNEIRRVYNNPKTLNVELPFSKTLLLQTGPDDQIYHPVRRGNDFRRIYDRFIDRIRRLDQVDAALEALPHVEVELGQEARTSYTERLSEIKKALYDLKMQSSGIYQRAHGTVVWTHAQQCVFFIMNEQDYIQQYHMSGNFYELDDLSYLSNIVAQNATFVDIGAHTGNHSIFIGLKVRPRKLICFEPNVDARIGLETNLRLNGLFDKADLSMSHFALGERNFDSFIVYSADNWGAGFITSNKALREFYNSVQVRRGDELLRAYDVDFIKIDVAGPVLPVLKGLDQTLTRCRSGLFLTATRDERGDVVAFLSAKNYKLIRETIAYQRFHKLVVIPN